MLSDADAIQSLKHALENALASLNLQSMSFGQPHLVDKAARDAEATFQGFTKAEPNREEARIAALRFLRGDNLDDQQYDQIASVLCEPIKERGGAQVIGSSSLQSLLVQYEKDALSGNLWRRVWHRLLGSYFSFSLNTASDAEKSGWNDLRNMLKRTWPHINLANQGPVVPAWIKIMRTESEILSHDSAGKYAEDYLEGRDEKVRQLADDLGIQQSSWFWQFLVISAVKTCCSYKDDQFKTRIPRLIELIKSRPVFRDDALEHILIRYYKCDSKQEDPLLRDYVIDKDVWRNPKLKAAGLATAWNRVPEPVWQMVLHWVNEKNLKLFFELLAGRAGSEKGRLKFWSRYMNQISWTRLMFGQETLALARSNPSIRNLIQSEYGASATLTNNNAGDAFMMQIGRYVIVEFSQTANACNAYDERKLKFDRYSSSYSGGTDDLKYGFNGDNEIRITHSQGWQQRAERDLKRIGIYPDEPSPAARPVSSPRFTEAVEAIPTYTSSSPSFLEAPVSANFTIKQLQNIISLAAGAQIKDLRSQNGGRLWVEDAGIEPLAKRLQTWGFQWSQKYKSWYYPDA